MHTTLYLESIPLSEYENSNKEKFISGLSNINIFIGPNNSGKSRFLRCLFKNQNIKFHDSEINLEEFNSIVSETKNKIFQYFEAHNIANFKGFNFNVIKEVNAIDAQGIKEMQSIVIEFMKLYNISGQDSYRAKNGQEYFIGKNYHDIKRVTIECVNKIKYIDDLNYYTDFRYTHIYMPVLRGLRGFSNDTDYYKNRTIKDYFTKIGENESLGEIYTGLTLYQDVKELLLGKREDRAKVKEFEEFISKTFFGGKDFSIVPSGTDEVVHIVLDKDERPIYELGDGIQSIIILTYPLFFNTDKKLKVFYEEPDLFLHPGFQRIFIETLKREEFKDFQFYFTTHSNHFLDMTLDYSKISVYSFSKLDEDKFKFENVENTCSEILRNLGVRNSSVFLTNCTIWVEGITDRIYIRKFLELIFEEKKHYIEDVHFSFVEYGGNNITHWSFLDDDDQKFPNIEVERLCGKLFLITDSDNAGSNKNGEDSKKKKRQKKLRDKLGNRYCCLKVKEIENLLGKEIILSTVKILVREENKNNIIIEEGATLNPNENIGQWIDDKIKNTGTVFKFGNTIKNKTEFAKNAVGFIKGFNDLQVEAKSLSRRLFKFIEEHNT